MTTAIVIFVIFCAVISALNTKEEIKRTLNEDKDANDK